MTSKQLPCQGKDEDAVVDERGIQQQHFSYQFLCPTQGYTVRCTVLALSTTIRFRTRF